MSDPFEAKDDRTKRAGTGRPSRAGLRPDERDPDEAAGEPGSAGGGENMSGTPGGGLAAGGLGGTNSPSGGVEDQVEQLNDAFGDGAKDVSGAEEVGGTPAEKRVSGGQIPPGEGLAPEGDLGDDRTIGSLPQPTQRKTSQPSPGK